MQGDGCDFTPDSLRPGFQSGWPDEKKAQVAREVSNVLLQEWGGPRSPLALIYIRDIIIPDLVNCFAKNADLLLNLTFRDIVAWKLKTQYAYPYPVADSLTFDMLEAVQRIGRLDPNSDPQEPWRRIFRLWVCGETLPAIEERTCYPLAYLELLLIRFKKMRAFLAFDKVTLPECLANPELKEFGFEQLSFFYQFQKAWAAEPLYKERLVLEQVIWELGLSRILEVSHLVAILEIIHAFEGRMDESDLASALIEAGNNHAFPGFSSWASPGLLPNFPGGLLSYVIDGLIKLQFLQKNKTGKLSLIEKSAATLAPFIAPKLVEELRMAYAANDSGLTQEILLQLNPEVLVKVLPEIAESFPADAALVLLRSVYKQVSRRIDLYLIPIFAKLPEGFELLMAALGDHDSLIRAKACEALGYLGNKEAISSLIHLLHDPVAGVKEMAAQALGDIRSMDAVGPLLEVAGDFYESPNVRGRAREALRKIESPSGKGHEC